MMKNILVEDQEGAVLILVMIVLVASIVMGVMAIRSSVQESRMAWNEKRYITNFANVESAVNLALVENTAALGNLSTTIDNTYDYPATAGLPSGTNVRVTLKAIKKPPIGKGYSVTSKTRYYTFQTTEAEDNQSIIVGAYKVFSE